MKHKLSILILLMLSLCACGASDVIDSTYESVPTPESTYTIPEPTVSTTEPTTLSTEDPNLLDITSGAFLNRFTDENSKTSLDYYTFIPENAVKNMPLIIFLHGDGEIGRINALQNIALIENARDYYGESYPFIAIAPCRVQKSWCTGSLPNVLLSLIDETVQMYEIDPEHIIISGFSSGAMGTWYMITNHTDYFSAAVPVSCPNEYPIIYDNIKNVPIWGFVGEKEEYYTIKMSEIINWTSQIGGDARLTVVEDMSHAGMDKAAFTQEVVEWMIAQ